MRQRGEADQLAKEESPRSLAATILHALRRISVFRSPCDLPGSVYNKMDAGILHLSMLGFSDSRFLTSQQTLGRSAGPLRG